jgi:hypothetical protein
MKERKAQRVQVLWCTKADIIPFNINASVIQGPPHHTTLIIQRHAHVGGLKENRKTKKRMRHYTPPVLAPIKIPPPQHYYNLFSGSVNSPDNP